MKLYNYNKFLNESNHDHIHKICQRHDIKNYSINPDGSIDVDDNVHLSQLKGIIPLKFNRVSGYFDCAINKLISLEGCPEYVGGSFHCQYNSLTSLIGGPKIVMGKEYLCQYNKLTDFYGFPEFYEGNVSTVGNHVHNVIYPISTSRVHFRGDSIMGKKYQLIHLLNEYDVIRNGKIIILDRLEAAYEGIGMKLPENIEIKGYEII